MLYVHEFMHIQRFLCNKKKPHGASGFVWKFLISCSNKKPHFAQGFVWH